MPRINNNMNMNEASPVTNVMPNFVPELASSINESEEPGIITGRYFDAENLVTRVADIPTRAPLSKAEMHERICHELNDLYVRKNRDYGDSFGQSYNTYGLTMPAIRLEDKLNRFKALRTAPRQVNDETLEDTLKDLANYAIMTIIELRNRR